MRWGNSVLYGCLDRGLVNAIAGFATITSYFTKANDIYPQQRVENKKIHMKLPSNYYSDNGTVSNTLSILLPSMSIISNLKPCH